MSEAAANIGAFGRLKHTIKQAEQYALKAQPDSQSERTNTK